MAGELASQLRDVETDWALLYLAQAKVAATSREAWNRLFTQYDQPVRRLIHRLVNNDELAQELQQEFWFRFVRGDFAHAAPERGRFRNLLRAAISNLVIDHFRREKRRRNAPIADLPSDESDLLKQLADRDAAFWRTELIKRAYATLRTECRESGDLHAVVLKVETKSGGKSSATKAGFLSQVAGRAVNADNYRQMLRRARVRFVALLMEEVGRSLTHPTPELIQEELTELRLLEYIGVRRPRR